jgi:predicted RNase H-like nuclease (RuvC/YqgF family)
MVQSTVYNKSIKVERGYEIMMKHEFEKLIGRQIPTGAYLEIEEAYVESKKEKSEFALEYTAEKVDEIVCRKYFEMEMKQLAAEYKVSGYQDHIKKQQEMIVDLKCRNDKLWNEHYGLEEEIGKLEEQIEKLKAKLYDKGLRGVA